MIDWRVNDPRKDLRAHGKGSKREQETLQAMSKRRAPQTTPATTATATTPGTATTTTSHATTIPFKGLTQFNATPESRNHAGLKKRLSLYEGPSYAFRQTKSYFQKDSLISKLALALAEHEAIDIKEFSESMEFFTHVRKQWRSVVRRERKQLHLDHKNQAAPPPPSSIVVDLCCGHGFTGLLFAIFERECSQVILSDRTRPKSFAKIYAAVLQVAPWVDSKVFTDHLGNPTEGDLQRIAASPLTVLPKGATLLAVHACGGATDLCIDIGLQLRSTCLYLLPCCYRAATMSTNNKLYVARCGDDDRRRKSEKSQKSQKSQSDSGLPTFKWRERRPYELEARLGSNLSTDIDRTYLLHEEGYDVTWAVLPPEITPMNRLILACLPGSTGSKGSEGRQGRQGSRGGTGNRATTGKGRERNEGVVAVGVVETASKVPRSLHQVVQLWVDAWVGLFQFCLSLPGYVVVRCWAMVVAVLVGVGVVGRGVGEAGEEQKEGKEGKERKEGGAGKQGNNTSKELEERGKEEEKDHVASSLVPTLRITTDPPLSSRRSRMYRKIKKQRQQQRKKAQQEQGLQDEKDGKDGGKEIQNSQDE